MGISAKEANIQRGRRMVNDLKFYDQPDGRCHECRWNNASKVGGLDCSVPQTLLVNHICIAKVQTAWLSNIEYEERRRNEDGDEWK
jgi:hypothetical protein